MGCFTGNDGSVIAYAENDGNGGYVITIVVMERPI